MHTMHLSAYLLVGTFTLWAYVRTPSLPRQEKEDTTAHFIAQCSALMPLQKNILGDFILSLDTLSNIHWFLLLKSAKASKRFY